MDGGDDQVQSGQDVVREVEAAVATHFQLHTLQNPEGGQLGVDRIDLLPLRLKARRV